MKKIAIVLVLAASGCASRHPGFISNLNRSSWTRLSDTVAICCWPEPSTNTLLAVHLAIADTPGSPESELYEAPWARVLEDDGSTVVLEMPEVYADSTNVPLLRFTIDYTIRSQQSDREATSETAPGAASEASHP